MSDALLEKLYSPPVAAAPAPSDAPPTAPKLRAQKSWGKVRKNSISGAGGEKHPMFSSAGGGGMMHMLKAAQKDALEERARKQRMVQRVRKKQVMKA